MWRLWNQFSHQKECGRRYFRQMRVLMIDNRVRIQPVKNEEAAAVMNMKVEEERSIEIGRWAF